MRPKSAAHSLWRRKSVDRAPQSTVFIVDDDAAMRRSLIWLLEAEGLSVKTYASAREFLSDYLPASPGCLILDLRLNGMNGLELQQQLHEKGVQLPVIMISGHADVPSTIQAMKTGVVDFLEKPFSHERLLEAVKRGLAEDAQQRSSQAQHVATSVSLARLTGREREVPERVVAGKPNKVVAAELKLSTKTVDRVSPGQADEEARRAVARRACPLCYGRPG